MLRYSVQQTDSGAEKERCPSRGIAFELKEPLAMFPATKHLRSHISWCLSRDSTKIRRQRYNFSVLDGRPESAVQSAGMPCGEEGVYVKLKIERNEKIRIVKKFEIFFDSRKDGEAGWRKTSCGFNG